MTDATVVTSVEKDLPKRIFKAVVSRFNSHPGTFRRDNESRRRNHRRIQMRLPDEHLLISGHLAKLGVPKRAGLVVAEAEQRITENHRQGKSLNPAWGFGSQNGRDQGH